jgi:hypothetical protein
MQWFALVYSELIIFIYILVQTKLGMVKLEHFQLIVQADVNKQSGLHAVPKVTEKHVRPNNFQKMSVSIAAQVNL